MFEGWELTSNPWLRRLLISRWPQWLVITAALAFFIYAILAGFFGTEVGNRNFAITLVWIAWWGLLMLLLVPVGGRVWCSVCPLPAPGDWLQRGGLLSADGRRQLGWGRRWPRNLRNLWPQNAGFILLALFSVVILTNPSVSAAVLLGLVSLAFVVSAIFERRAFCRYLCPVGGFIGLYALASPLALRVKDREVCRQHPTKECYRGSDHGHGCPWMVYPGTLDRNAACGLCLECLRTCPLDNVAVVLRRPGVDLVSKSSHPTLSLDEAYKGFIMLASAMVYSLVMMGPWGEVKEAALGVGTLNWVAYAAGFLGVTLLGIPLAYLLAAWMGCALNRREVSPFRVHFLRSTTGLVPLGLAAWVAFSLSFVLINGSYVVATLSDPLGWGWNLFGTAALSWQPLLSGWVPSLQTVVLIGGLIWSTTTTLRAIANDGRVSRSVLLQASPTLLLNASWISLMIGFYL